jgi:hypothetical protein
MCSGNKVEPASDPREECRQPVVWGEHCRPKVWASASRMCRRDLRHSQADEGGEEAHNEPSYGHDRRSSSGEAIGEEGCDAGDHGNDREADAEVVDKAPVSV